VLSAAALPAHSLAQPIETADANHPEPAALAIPSPLTAPSDTPLPDAPNPHVAATALAAPAPYRTTAQNPAQTRSVLDTTQAPPQPQTQSATPAQSPSAASAQDSSSSQPQQPGATPSAPASSATPAPGQPQDSAQTPPPPVKSKVEIAEEQLAQEKKQRVFFFLPSFNTSYIDSAVSLTWKQKFKLAFSQVTDPVQFGIAGFAAGLDEAEGGDSGYGGGPVGYLKRVGADYADSFDGNMIGNALLPSILHQDPRFFRRGYGSKTRRIFYAISTSFVCKHDVTGKWEPNFSNLLGNVAGGAISNFYVPKSERGVANVFQGAALVTIEGGAGAILQEFWPDISRHFFHIDPTHGQDAINNAAHK
jgi:hypothetical protein